MPENPERVQCPFAVKTKQGGFLCTYFQEEKVNEGDDEQFDGKVTKVNDDSLTNMFPVPISEAGCFSTFRCKYANLTFVLFSRKNDDCYFPEIENKQETVIADARDSLEANFFAYDLTDFDALGGLFLLYQSPVLMDKKALVPDFYTDFVFFPARMADEDRLILSKRDKQAIEKVNKILEESSDERLRRWSDELL